MKWKNLAKTFGVFFVMFVAATVVYALVRPTLQKLPVVGSYL